MKKIKVVIVLHASIQEQSKEKQPGARVKCIQDYVKTFLRENPDHIIIQVAANDISRNKQAEQIAKSIVELALSEKCNS